MKIVAAIIFLLSAASAQFPSFIKVCKVDTKINDCIKQNILSAQEHLKNGIPSLFLPKFEPLILPKDYEFKTNMLNMILYKDFIFNGMDEFTIKKIDFNLNKNHFELEWIFKDTYSHGKYKFIGTLLKYKVNTDGYCTVNTTNFGVNLKMQGERVEKEGKTYINFNKIDTKFVMDDVKMYFFFENLLSDVKETESANKFLNENAGAASLQFKPIVDTLLVGLSAGSIQKLFNAHPIDELFIF